MRQIDEVINRLLADWNPIGVPDDIALYEYKAYIPLIIESLGSKRQLILCLEDIIINRIGINYDTENEEYKKDLQKICDKLIEFTNQFKI